MANFISPPATENLEISNFQINFRSLLSYTSSLDESDKIRGIPFSISEGGTAAGAIPKPEFEVAAEVEIGDIVHEMSKTFLEKITIGRLIT